MVKAPAPRSRARPTSRTAPRRRRAGSCRRRVVDRPSIQTSETCGTRLRRRTSHQHAGKIEDADPQPVPYPVIRFSVTPRPIDHVDIGDGVAVAAEQRRQKTMQPVEIGQRQKCVAPEHFQSAAGVARAVAQDRAAHAVRDARLELLERRGAPPDALARHKPDRSPPCSKACSSAGMNDGSFWPSPSSVAIERRARGSNAAAHRGRLAAGLHVLDLTQTRTFGLQRVQRRFGPVARAVIDVDELEVPAPAQRSRDLVGERTDILGFVAHRHDHRNGRRNVSGMDSMAHDRFRKPGSIGTAWGCAAFLLANQRAGNRLDAAPGRPRAACTAPSASGTKTSPRAANQLRTRIAPKRRRMRRRPRR